MMPWPREVWPWVIEIATVQLIGDKLQLANRLAGQRPLTFRTQPWNPNSEANRNSKRRHLPHNFSSYSKHFSINYCHTLMINPIVLCQLLNTKYSLSFFRRLVIKLSNSGSLFTEKYLSSPPARWYFSVNSSPSFDNLILFDKRMGRKDRWIIQLSNNQTFMYSKSCG